MKKVLSVLLCAALLGGIAGCSEIGSSEPPAERSETADGGSLEPPLSEEDWEIPLPDFLDEEQQALYLRAREVFPALSGDTTNIDRLFGGEESGESFEQDGSRYLISTGRYRQWADFMEMMRSIFTEEYIGELTGAGTDFPVFFERDGLLCYLDAARGSLPGYQGPDAYELTGASADEISFNLIGHYEPLGGGEIDTESYPIRMVLTEEGWRFSEFHIAW